MHLLHKFTDLLINNQWTCTLLIYNVYISFSNNTVRYFAITVPLIQHGGLNILYYSET